MENRDVERELELTSPDSIEDVQKKQIPAAAVVPEFLDSIQAEIDRGYRELVYKDKIIRVHFPDVGDEEYASLKHMQAYNIFLQSEGMLNEKEMRRIYEEKGMWTDTHEKRLLELQDGIQEQKEAITELILKSTDDETGSEYKKRAVEEFAEQQKMLDEFTKLQMEKTSLFSTSVESMAKDIGLKAKLSRCARYEDGTQVWADLDDINREKDQQKLMEVLKVAMYFWGGIPDDFFEDSPDEQSGESKEQSLEMTSEQSTENQ